MEKSESNQIKAMSIVLLTGVVVMLLKFAAYFLTHSTAILTDALESIINIVAGAFALYSVYLAAKPKDSGHPYGHGKIEFISAGFEGGLIFIAAIVILIKSVDHLLHPVPLEKLDTGILLSGIGGALNFILGRYLISTGTKSKSITLVADGKHLLTDTYTSFGLIVGLVAIYFTNLLWLDSVIAAIFGVVILVTGYKLIRKSLSGLMDEADEESLNEVVKVINQHRSARWIDIHNLRVLRYGAHLHIDCHITLPWYDNLQSSHDELKNIETFIYKELKGKVEIFIHPDPCIPDSCSICNIDDCLFRKQAFDKKVEWTLENLLQDMKHTKNT